MYLVQNVTSLGLFDSYSNTLLLNLWNRDQIKNQHAQKGAAIMAT